jgi:hypothetical protein
MPRTAQPGSRPVATRRRLLTTVAGVLSLSQLGCIQFAANMVNAIRGDAVPAEYEGFEKQRVAVYTISDTGRYTEDVAARLLTRKVSEILLDKVKDIRLVRETEIGQWRDTQGYNEIDAVNLGRGVKADKVLSIELMRLRLLDGQTMYRGHADVNISVYDVESGSLEFRRSLEDYTYPAMAGLPVTESSEERFRRLYLDMLAERVARHFFPYDFRDSVAADAEIASF